MHTPVPEYLQEIIAAHHNDDSGAVADYIPELAAADPTPFAVALCTPDGTVYGAGDSDRTFSIQSISKPFSYALALQDHGIEKVSEYVDVEPSGDAFNEVSLDKHTGRPKNPMINIGAITTYALIGDFDLTEAERTQRMLDGYSAFAGRKLDIDESVCASELSESWRNQALANFVKAHGRLIGQPIAAVRGYTKQCSVRVTATDLAVMGMTLASGGINPKTGQRVVAKQVAQQVLSVMTTCGMYDSAGDWLSHVGIPAKSGVSGGLLGALPGQVGMGAFSPRLDRFGHSVRGVKVFEHLSRDMGLHLMGTPPTSIEAVGQRSRTDDGRRLIAIQGAITFTTAEMVLRHFETIPPGSDEIVVDFTLVSVVNRVGAVMITEGIRRLGLDGHDVVLIDPHERIDLNRDGHSTSVLRIEHHD